LFPKAFSAFDIVAFRYGSVHFFSIIFYMNVWKRILVNSHVLDKIVTHFFHVKLYFYLANHFYICSRYF
jgi:hypothetical protein